jgi:hypothetical protein
MLLLPARPSRAEDFDVDKAISTANTAADHEAIPAYFDKEAAEAQAGALRSASGTSGPTPVPWTVTGLGSLSVLDPLLRVDEMDLGLSGGARGGSSLGSSPFGLRRSFLRVD